MAEKINNISGDSPDFSKLFEEEGAVILLRGKNSFGDKIYSYVKVTFKNVERMQESIRNQQTFNPSDFGEVVAAGTGEPSDELKAEIASQYPMVKQQAPIATPTPAAPLPKKAWDEY